MKQLRIQYFAIIGVILFLASCASSKELVYFGDNDVQKVKANLLNYEPEIQPGDELNINVSALNTEAAIPFNLYEASNNISIPRPITYIVGLDGKINFPVIGKVLVGGDTTQKISYKLATLIAPYIKNPIVNIRLVNFKISVLGEVRNPGTYAVPDERISILAAIGLAGDLTIQGKRNNVLLIREKDGKRSFVTIDLTNKELFNSPYYYLAQNDVLYITPNKVKINSSAVGANSSIIISSVSTLISLLAILNIIK